MDQDKAVTINVKSLVQGYMCFFFFFFTTMKLRYISSVYYLVIPVLARSSMDYDKNTGVTPLSQIETEVTMGESVTPFISGVLLSSKGKNKIVLCDSPRFDDSAGCEIDGANGLGIVKVVSKAKCVKVLSAIETRMKGFKNVATDLATIHQIMKNF